MTGLLHRPIGIRWHSYFPNGGTMVQDLWTVGRFGKTFWQKGLFGKTFWQKGLFGKRLFGNLKDFLAIQRINSGILYLLCDDLHRIE